jgi:glycosyltransferase involved in cell wall biosynthesis
MNDESVKMAYVGASAFLFPSLAEGFGWPIAEAMSSGCPVVTTNEAPMTEVAGNAGFLIARRPIENDLAKSWAVESAGVVNSILQLSAEEHQRVVNEGIKNACRFNTQQSLNNIEAIYSDILQSHKK